ncbi:hypothetical protein BGZ49_000070 [Haplosporangium sp. Z 27]|nr:hypothetical protein BGZ49_000070 [Haplosporangium sp. Z 27]
MNKRDFQDNNASQENKRRRFSGRRKMSPTPSLPLQQDTISSADTKKHRRVSFSEPIDVEIEAEAKYKVLCSMLKREKRMMPVEPPIAVIQEGSIQEDSVQEGSVQEDLVQEGSIQEDSVQEDMVQEGSVQEDLVQEGSVQEDLVQEGSIQEGSIQEDSVQEDLVQEHTVQEDSVQEHSVQEHSVQEDSVQEDSVQEDSVQEHSVQEDSVQEHSVQEGIQLSVAPSRPGSPVPREEVITIESDNKDVHESKGNIYHGMMIEQLMKAADVSLSSMKVYAELAADARVLSENNYLQHEIRCYHRRNAESYERRYKYSENSYKEYSIQVRAALEAENKK